MPILKGRDSSPPRSVSIAAPQAGSPERRPAYARGPAVIAISVVSHGHGSLLTALLDDLVLWRRATDQLIVTLNIPEAASFSKERWQGIEWRENREPKGFGANHNSALHNRLANWYAVINPDIRLGNDAVHDLADLADARPELALVAPVVVDRNGVVQDSARRLLTPLTLAARVVQRLIPPRTGQSLPPRRPDWLAGMFLVVRCEVFAALGGFDERYFLYCEDIDFSLRVQLAGGEIAYLEEVTVVHDAQRDSHRSLPHLRWHVGSVLKLWRSRAFWRYLAGKTMGGRLAMPPSAPIGAARSSQRTFR